MIGFPELENAVRVTQVPQASGDEMPDKDAVRSFNDLLTGMELPHPLRDYQKEGVTFLMQSESALLADEMGLGKTVQIIVAVRALHDANPSHRTLVVAPRSICTNWQREFNCWAPDLLVRMAQGSARNRQGQYGLPIPVVIATYEQIRLDADVLDAGCAFDLVVLDEAQRIKDESSSTSVACRGIVRTRSWALTGTPVENHSDDLIALFTFVRRQLLFRGISLGDLHRRIQPFFLRRTKRQVLPELPPILVQDYELQLHGVQLAVYRELWRSRRGLPANAVDSSPDRGMLALITELKQVCNFEPDSGESAKLEALDEILGNLSEPDDKVLLFSQYVKTLTWLSQRIGSMPYRMYHGGMQQQERDAAVQWFRKSRGPCVLLMSLKAGGVGLNLQEASTVVMFDRWWNPAVEDQAMQRAHRFGRNRPLHVIRFLLSSTIEERIDALLREKKAVFEEYIEGAENADVRPMSRTDLRRVLGLSRGGPE